MCGSWFSRTVSVVIDGPAAKSYGNTHTHTHKSLNNPGDVTSVLVSEISNSAMKSYLRLPVPLSL